MAEEGDIRAAVEAGIAPLRSEIQQLRDEVHNLPYLRSDVHSETHSALNSRVGNVEDDVRVVAKNLGDTAKTFDARISRAVTLAVGGLLFPIITGIVVGIVLYAVTKA